MQEWRAEEEFSLRQPQGPEDDTLHAFERLLARIEDGLAVPFLGAGVSAMARPSHTSSAPDGYQPSIRWLNRRLVEMLLSELETSRGRRRLARSVFVDAWLHAPKIRRLRNSTENERALRVLVRYVRRSQRRASRLSSSTPCVTAALDTLVAAARNRLDHLAEAAIWSFGAAHVCQHLQLELFAELEPTDAHVYLAYLAREGLIVEILTTNYDTCIEKAFERTFHPDERRCGERQLYSVDPAPQSSQRENELHVVRGLDEYRARGGRRWSRVTGHEPRPALRLFKLNGCAHAYREELRLAVQQEHSIRNERREASERRKCAANRVILTERQLQSFRRERWAQELFQDRARCQAFVFSGFGSEEPQIRHTALAVMNEWGSEPSQCCWYLPNAPFMAAHDAELSFTQYQLMRGYRDAHQCDQCGNTGCVSPGLDHDSRRRLDTAVQSSDLACPGSEPEAPRNCFTGSSAPWFDPNADRRLSADLFWKRTFQASFLRQVKHACDGPGAFADWLGQHSDASKFALQRFFRWLSRLEVGSSDGSSPTEGPSAPRPWQTRFTLLEPDPEPDAASDCVAPLQLSRWLMAIRGSVKRWQIAQHPSHPYFPLWEDPLLILGSLFLVHLLTPLSEPDASAPKPGPLGLEVAFTANEKDSSSVALHLVSKEWPESNELPNDARLVRQVVVPSLRRLPRESRMATKGRTIRMGRCVRIAAEELLKVERGNRGSLLQAFAEAPVDKHRARLHRSVNHQPGAPDHG